MLGASILFPPLYFDRFIVLAAVTAAAAAVPGPASVPNDDFKQFVLPPSLECSCDELCEPAVNDGRDLLSVATTTTTGGGGGLRRFCTGDARFLSFSFVPFERDDLRERCDTFAVPVPFVDTIDA